VTLRPDAQRGLSMAAKKGSISSNGRVRCASYTEPMSEETQSESDRAVLARAETAIRDASLRGVAPMIRATTIAELQRLEASGWSVHTYAPQSPHDGEHWILILDPSMRADGRVATSGSTIAPNLSPPPLRGRAKTLQRRAVRELAYAARRGIPAMYTVHFSTDVAILESLGWSLHSVRSEGPNTLAGWTMTKQPG
jgi:hypothetical protein